MASGHVFEKNERGHLVRSGQTHFQRPLVLFVSGGARVWVVVPLPIRQGQLLRKSLGWGSWDRADCVPVREVGKGAVFGVLYRSLNDARVCRFRQGHLLD